ncbi:hypothetical protein BC832DRAFT_593561 [Gaertneriomyces semiglobifer]|nr:hypothetical protein BC832DRAFT_593561 [Gaertneriomyces semiglobifer]
MPKAYLTRTEHFSAAHRLHSPSLSDEDNLRIFGKCNHKSGHGHNYKVEVTVKGDIDPHSGMILNITVLKDLILKHVLTHLDHRNLDVDVAYFKDKASTAENIAVFVWKSLEGRIKELADARDVRLWEVRLEETERNVVVYRGE